MSIISKSNFREKRVIEPCSFFFYFFFLPSVLFETSTFFFFLFWLLQKVNHIGIFENLCNVDLFLIMDFQWIKTLKISWQDTKAQDKATNKTNEMK
jgi:hypothetical protein